MQVEIESGFLSFRSCVAGSLNEVVYIYVYVTVFEFWKDHGKLVSPRTGNRGCVKASICVVMCSNKVDGCLGFLFSWYMCKLGV